MLMNLRACRHVLNDKAGRHPKATRLILTCLNHLRGYRLDAISSGGKGKFAQEALCWQKVSSPRIGNAGHLAR